MTKQDLETEISKILAIMANDCENVHQARAKGHSIVTTPMSDHAAAIRAEIAKAERRGELKGRINEHHAISLMLTNDDLGKLQRDTIRGLKARRAGLLSELKALEEKQ